MSRYWEFVQKNVFSELLSLLGRMTQENLTHQIEYLKAENEILRKRVGRSIRPTSIERKKLVKFGVHLGKDLRNIITVVTYETFLLWARGYKRNKDPERIKKRGRPKTLEEIRKLVVRPHSSMGNRPLESRLTKNAGEIKCQTRLGGIIKHYYRG